MRGFFASCISVLFSGFCLSPVWAQQPSPDLPTLADIVTGTLGCQLVKPMVAQTTDSVTRVGSILSGIKTVPSSKGGTAYLQILDTDDYCSPSSPLPTPAPTWQPDKWTYTTQISGGIDASIGSYFNLGKISLDRIKQITVNIKDANVYSVGDAGKRVAIVREIKSRPDCAKYLKPKPPQANFISTPQLITNVCTGTVDIGFVFDRGIDISALSLQISTVKVGLSFSVHETLGNEVACGTSSGGTSQAKGTTANPAASNTTQSAASKAAAAVIQALADAAQKQAIEALEKSKLLSGQAAAEKDANKKQAAQEKAAAAAEDATAAKAKANDAQKQVAASKASPVQLPSGKCYDSVQLVSDAPVVIGIDTTGANRY